jgi:Dopey, N-terminal
MQFKEIPRKLIVSKRLSQCLNPALPTGVHQRALDVYSHILAVLGVSATYITPIRNLSDCKYVVGRLTTRFTPLVIGFISFFRICCDFCQGKDEILWGKLRFDILFSQRY